MESRSRFPPRERGSLCLWQQPFCHSHLRHTSFPSLGNCFSPLFFFFFAPPCTNAGHNLFNNLVKVGRVTALRSSQVCVVGGSVAVKPGYAMGVRLWRCVFSVCRFKSGLSAEDFISMCRCRQHTCRLHISPLTSVCLFSMSVVLGVHEGASFAVTDIFVVCIYSEVDFFILFF